MKAFISKYKWTILFWIVFLSIVLYFAPRQNRYYLDNDIKSFKKQYLAPVLIWTWVATSILLLFFLFRKTKSAKKSLLALLTASLSIAFFLFIFQDLFLAGSLFINRQFKRDSLQKVYTASYLAGEEKTKSNFIPYDVSLKQISIDRKLIEKLYRPELKQNDTIILAFNKGLLGIEFQPEAFSNE